MERRLQEREERTGLLHVLCEAGHRPGRVLYLRFVEPSHLTQESVLP